MVSICFTLDQGIPPASSSNKRIMHYAFAVPLQARIREVGWHLDSKYGSGIPRQVLFCYRLILYMPWHLPQPRRKEDRACLVLSESTFLPGNKPIRHKATSPMTTTIRVLPYSKYSTVLQTFFSDRT